MNTEDTITITWNIEDVREIDGAEHFTDDQCREVLGRVKRGHDCNIGVNWDVIEWHVNELIDESKGG